MSELASIAHDLRSPLAGLVALLDMLAGEVDGPLNDSQKARLARARATVDRLNGLVNAIAELAQVESGRLVLARGPVNLDEAAQRVRQQLEPLLRSRAVSLQIVVPPDLAPLQGDPQRTGQMLASLVTGLVKQVEGTTLEMTAAPRGTMIEVTLREAARGLPVEALPPAFDQEPASGSDDAMLRGIGLSLARALAVLHGGSLSFGRDAGGALAAALLLPAEMGDSKPRAERPADLHPAP